MTSVPHGRIDPTTRPGAGLRLLASVTVVLLLAGASAASAQSRALRYQAILDLDARDIDGTAWRHQRLAGRITLIDFWATWCAPCLRELPYLKRARARYGDRFEILGISLDTMGRPSLRRWIEGHGVDWPQVHADRGYDDPIAVAFAIDRLPTNLLLDAGGRLRAVDVRGEQLFVEIDRLLAERSH